MPEGRVHLSEPSSGRHRRPAAAVAVAAIALAVAACSSSTTSSTTTPTTAPSTTGPTTSGTTGAPTTAVPGSSAVVATGSRGSFGVILTDGRDGPTLYRYTPDGTGPSTCYGACATAWPPLTVPAGTTVVAAGAGVPAGSLGTTRRTDGTLQVTFRGMPLYRYALDTTPTATSGQGVDGTWFVVQPTGASTSGSSTTTTTASGY